MILHKLGVYLVGILIAFISMFYFYLSSQNSIVGLVADDAVYLLMTDYFSPYYSSLSQTASYVMHISQFPPLYPYLLAVLGSGSGELMMAHIITTSCFFGGVMFYALWLDVNNISRAAILCLSLLFIFLPASLLMNIDLWSEHLYLLLTMSALFFVYKAEKNKRYWLIAVILVGLIPLVRIVGFTFLLAFFVSLYVNKINFRYKFIAISIIPFLIWKILFINADFSEHYGNTLMELYQNDLGVVIKHLFTTQLLNLWSGWHECFDLHKNLWSGIFCAFILLMALIQWFIRAINKSIDSYYVFFYLIAIWLWPAPDHDLRFLFVVMPILLFYSYLSLIYILNYDVVKNLRSIISLASIFLVLAICLPTNLYAINRLFLKIPADLEAYKYTRYWLTQKTTIDALNSIQIMDKLTQSYVESSQYIPEDDCVYSVHYEKFMFDARRLAFPLPFKEEIANQHEITPYFNKCKYIHINNTNSQPYFPGGYPIDFLQDNFRYLMFTRMTNDINSPVVGTLIQLE